MTMGLIGCRSCVEPSCSGCNLYELEKALRKGYFDAMKVRGGLHICAEVAEVVRCKDCRFCMEFKDKDGFYGHCRIWITRTISDYAALVDADGYCSYGERKEGQR